MTSASINAGEARRDEDEGDGAQAETLVGTTFGFDREDEGIRSSTLIHSAAEEGLTVEIGSSRRCDSSSDLGSLSTPVLSPLTSGPDPSEGALLANLPFLACPAALAPILIPAQTPRATPPPIPTAELRIAPCTANSFRCA